MATGRGWAYVNEERTHEVRLVLGDGAVTVIESAVGERDPSAQLRSVFPSADEWDARAHKIDLEARLGMIGNYWRNDGDGWRRLPRRPEIVSLRPVTLRLDAAREATVHLFHRPGRVDRMLLSLPVLPGRASLAEVDLLKLVPASARILHEGLPLGPLRSIVARESLRAHDAGYAKLTDPTDLALVFGVDWEAKLSRAARADIRALPREIPMVAPSDDADALRATAEKILGDPRLLRVQRTYLEPFEEEEMLEGGDFAIAKTIQAKRRVSAFSDQHLLSVLEASLLLRDRLRRRVKLDPALVERVQRLAFYLPA